MVAVFVAVSVAVLVALAIAAAVEAAAVEAATAFPVIVAIKLTRQQTALNLHVSVA